MLCVWYRRKWLLVFFKQKTAYGMLRSLVGSEMCIRDRVGLQVSRGLRGLMGVLIQFGGCHRCIAGDEALACLLYTSDAADELLCVDLGGRRIIKKKKTSTQALHNDHSIHTA